jgi:DNA invertase Pin-like site-specific DNA recombinase
MTIPTINAEQNAVIFARVSTVTQNTDRQISDLQELANNNPNIKVLKVFREIISGANTKRDGQRPVLDSAIKYCIDNDVKNILVSELTRLGRNISDVVATIDTLNQHKINVYIKDLNINTLRPDGTIDPATYFLISILSCVAYYERGNIKERMTSGWREWRYGGGRSGRPKGTGMTDAEFLDKHYNVYKELKRGESIIRAAKLAGVHRNTAARVYNRLVEMGKIEKRTAFNSPDYKEKRTAKKPS